MSNSWQNVRFINKLTGRWFGFSFRAALPKIVSRLRVNKMPGQNMTNIPNIYNIMTHEDIIDYQNGLS